MCTSIVMKSSNNFNVLARTMDFSYELDPVMAIFPRNMPLPFVLAPEINKHYAFLGLTKDVGNYYLADGVNEAGLAAATLYFEDHAHYADQIEESHVGLAPHEVVLWMLAHCQSIEDVEAEFKKITIVKQKLGFLGVIPPLHWVFLDKSGHSIVVEITKSKTNIYENKLGIMTNAPDYPWHLTNIRNYIQTTPEQKTSLSIKGVKLKPFGQGAGTSILPGGYTSPARFIRTLYNRLTIQTPQNKDELIIAAMHVLNGVDIAKGSMMTQRHTLDYTQYTSYISVNDQSYYYRLYNDLNVHAISLSDYEIEHNEIVIVSID